MVGGSLHRMRKPPAEPGTVTGSYKGSICLLTRLQPGFGVHTSQRDTPVVFQPKQGCSYLWISPTNYSSFLGCLNFISNLMGKKRFIIEPPSRDWYFLLWLWV